MCVFFSCVYFCEKPDLSNFRTGALIRLFKKKKKRKLRKNKEKKPNNNIHYSKPILPLYSLLHTHKYIIYNIYIIGNYLSKIITLITFYYSLYNLFFFIIIIQFKVYTIDAPPKKKCNFFFFETFLRHCLSFATQKGTLFLYNLFFI